MFDLTFVFGAAGAAALVALAAAPTGHWLFPRRVPDAVDGGTIAATALIVGALASLALFAARLTTGLS